MQDTNQKQFTLALVLAWTPWVPTLIGLVNAFRGISNSKATGFAAVAGGVAESLALCGLITLVASQTVAILWLSRSFSRDHASRNIISAISIALSGLMLIMVIGFLWFLWFHMPRS